jgi:thiol-disulfide isomerase/thioredoxin
MIRFIYVAVFLIGTCTTVHSQKIRDFLLDDITGETYSFTELKGEHLTIIDFWASWCKPCLKAMPKLEIIREKYENQGVSLISINADGPRSIAKVAPLVKSLGLKNIVLKDINNEVINDLNVFQLPTLLIVDDHGQVAYRHEGYSDGDENVIEEELRKMLAELE